MAKKNSFIEFEQIIERGCGIDVHQKEVVVTIRGKGITTMTKSYSTYTNSLKKLKVWLKKHKVTHLAMESTGVYWKPLFNILNDEFEILLVNARHVKNVPGHKTDKSDSRWLAKLLLSGLLRGSFIPTRDIRELRDLTRYRIKLVNTVSAEKNRVQKILEDANIKLSVVLSDIFGVSGQKILRLIIEGKYNPREVPYYIHGNVKKESEEIIEAVTGYVTEHHRFMLSTLLENINKLEETIQKVEARIEERVGPHYELIELLQTIPGVGLNGAIGIISEIGTDMDNFRTHQHLASWAGMSPGSNESAGKNKSGRLTYGNKYLRTLLVELAWSASRSKNTYLSSKYRSLVGRRGKKRAVVAVGHKILIAAYYIIKDKTEFNELGVGYLDNRRKDKLINYYKKQLAELDPEFDLEKATAA